MKPSYRPVSTVASKRQDTFRTSANPGRDTEESVDRVAASRHLDESQRDVSGRSHQRGLP